MVSRSARRPDERAIETVDRQHAVVGRRRDVAAAIGEAHRDVVGGERNGGVLQLHAVAFELPHIVEPHRRIRRHLLIDPDDELSVYGSSRFGIRRRFAPPLVDSRLAGLGTNGSVPSHRYRFVVLAIGLTKPAIIELAFVMVPALYV